MQQKQPVRRPQRPFLFLGGGSAGRVRDGLYTTSEQNTNNTNVSYVSLQTCNSSMGCVHIRYICVCVCLHFTASTYICIRSTLHLCVLNKLSRRLDAWWEGADYLATLRRYQAETSRDEQLVRGEQSKAELSVCPLWLPRARGWASGEGDDGVSLQCEPIQKGLPGTLRPALP